MLNFSKVEKMNFKRLICLFLVVFSVFGLTARTDYYTYLNKFGGFNKNFTDTENNVLVDLNDSISDRLNLIEMDCAQSSFSLYVRFANKRNLEGKSYKVFTESGKKKSVTNPVWGLVWNYNDENSYCAVRLKGANSRLYDAMDERSLCVEVVEVKDGKETVLKKENVKNGVDLYDDYNVVMIKYDGLTTHLYLGDKKLLDLCSIDVKYNGEMKVGYLNGAASKVEMERFVIKTNKEGKHMLATEWTKSNIDDYLAKNGNEDLVIGKWSYLDRNIDEKRLKLGGKYTLAVVKNTNGGYDILYYEGAVVNNTKWQCGMLKGTLSPTRFSNNFDLAWYDSVMDVFSDDTYATIDDNGILTLIFPVEKGQIRFVKDTKK